MEPMKLIGKLIKLALLGIVLALIFHNFAARWALTLGLRHALGAPVSVDSAQVDLRNTHVLFRGVRIDNPRGFPNDRMLDIPLLFVDLEFSSLWERKIHLAEVEVQLREVRVVRGADKRINLLFLKVFEHRQQPVPAGESQPVKVQIDNLIFSSGQVVYTDLAGGRSSQRVIRMNLNRVSYRNVGSLSGIVEVIAWEVLKGIGIGELQNAAGGFLQKIFGG